jgi:hypothetical protein
MSTQALHVVVSKVEPFEEGDDFITTVGWALVAFNMQGVKPIDGQTKISERELQLNGAEAKQYEFILGEKSRILMTYADFGGTIYQFLMFTAIGAEYYQTHKPTFEQILASVDFDPDVLNPDEDVSARTPAYGDNRTIASKVSGLTIEVPNTWQDEIIDGNEVLCVGLYSLRVQVFEYPAEETPEISTLEDFASERLEIAQNFDMNSEFSELADVFVSDILAKQVEYIETVEHEDGDGVTLFKRQNTYMENDGVFYIFNFLTLEDEFDYYKPVFDKILASAKF